MRPAAAARATCAGALLRQPLEGRPPIAAALRCLHDTDRPFALVGAWADGGAVLGCSPMRVAHQSEDPFSLFGQTSRLQQRGGGVGGGWVGYLGYPLRRAVEDVHRSPPRASCLPDFALAYYDHVVRCDAAGAWWFEALWSPDRAHELEKRRSWWAGRLADPPAERSARTAGWRLEPDFDGHAGVVAACRDRIYAGDLFQANICAEFKGRVVGPPLELFILGTEALAPDRAAYLEGPWGAIVSLSPELFLERRGRDVLTAPIKGTWPGPDEPCTAAAELTSSAKDRAENVMIVDLMRNDLGRVCVPGTIDVRSLAQAQRHAGVWNLVSEVTGCLRPDVDDGELLRATFPPGSVTGAPKVAAMNVIAELESSDRRAYTGAIGIASPHSGLELSVAIRTFELTGNEVRLGVGGGVVADSDPVAEARELATKAAPLFGALGATLPPFRRGGVAPLVTRLGPVPIGRPDPRRGVFETVLVRDGRPLRIEAHLERLRTSAAGLYDAALPDSLGDDISAALSRARGSQRLRIEVRPPASPELALCLELGALAPAAGVRMRTWTLPGGLGPHKWADRRLLVAMESNHPGLLPLLVDADGQVLEASRASVFALGPDGVLRTPPDDGRILPGLARAGVLTRATGLGLRARVEPLSLDDLWRAHAVFLTNALRCSPVCELDGRALRRDPELLALFERALEQDGAGHGSRAGTGVPARDARARALLDDMDRALHPRMQDA